MDYKKQLIEPRYKQISISRQCELINLNRSSYYFKNSNELKNEDYMVMKKMDEIFTEHPYYGTRRMSKVLKKHGYDVGRKKLRKYYQLMGLEPIYPKVNLSRRNQAHKVYPYLLNDYEITQPNQVWGADITYIRLTHGFIYLVAIIDWHSRYVLSWAVSISLESDFCIEALNEALSKYGRPDIFNTDQGVQFTCKGFTEILGQNKIKISMDSKGRALDNVFIERFWRSLKQEKIYLISLNTVQAAKEAINEYMNFYNNLRPHQSLGYMTPKDVQYSTVIKNLVEETKKPKDFFVNSKVKIQTNLLTTWRNIISHFN